MRNLMGFLTNEDGMGTVEIVLIIVVLVGLVVVFKKQISGIVDGVVSKVKDDTSTEFGVTIK